MDFETPAVFCTMRKVCPVRSKNGNITFGLFYTVKIGTIVPGEKEYINKCYFGGRDWEYVV